MDTKGEWEMTNQVDISSRILAISPNIRVWSGRKYDREVSEEVAQQKAASRNSGRYNKNLLPEGADSLKAVQQKAGHIRNEHYRRTLPLYDGVQAIRAEGYFDYAAWWNQQEAEYKALIDSFVAEYPALMARASKALGDMWRAEDYPSQYEVAGKFGVDINVFPLPAGTQFEALVSTLGQEVVDGLATNLQEQQQRMIRDAMTEAWQRLYEVVRKMQEKCAVPVGEKGSVFRDSMLENLLQVVDVMPVLNLTDDRALDDIVQRVKQELAPYTLEGLRNVPDARQAAADKAAEIMRTMGAYMGGQP